MAKATNLKSLVDEKQLSSSTTTSNTKASTTSPSIVTKKLSSSSSSSTTTTTTTKEGVSSSSPPTKGENSSLKRKDHCSFFLIFLVSVSTSILWSKYSEDGVLVPDFSSFMGRLKFVDYHHEDYNKDNKNQPSISSSSSLPPKYESDLVSIQVPTLFFPEKCDFHPEVLSEMASVLEVMGREDVLRKNNEVFVMLNGQNYGIYMSWEYSETSNCLHALALTAAISLDADLDYILNGLYIMSQMGELIETAEDLNEARIVHILLEGQLWIWPGIEVGHEYNTDGVRLVTASLEPKVFTVHGFFTEEEADTIIELGKNNLVRSPVDSYHQRNGISLDRTSDTAFLNDSHFTRDFRRRSTRLARLPSPSFAERLQLVRYKEGQFFRKHMDTFSSKVFVEAIEGNVGYQEFLEWVNWTAKTINDLQEHAPEHVRSGTSMFPVVSTTFEDTLLRLFLDRNHTTNFFARVNAVDWGTWIQDNLGLKGVLATLLQSKRDWLQEMIVSWETIAGSPDVMYKIPKRRNSGVSHLFRWIRTMKNQIATANTSLLPLHVRTSGHLYPTYKPKFQILLVQLIYEDYSRETLTHFTNDALVTWMDKNRDKDDCLQKILQVYPYVIDLVIRSWEKRAGALFHYVAPKHIKHFEPQRYVTLFLYLNDVTEGGETVFPHSNEKYVEHITRNGMEECSNGLAVPARKATASLFYSQTPEGDIDALSEHGGCPPHQGIKWGGNSFMWNADAEEGASAWGF